MIKKKIHLFSIGESPEPLPSVTELTVASIMENFTSKVPLVTDRAGDAPVVGWIGGIMRRGDEVWGVVVLEDEGTWERLAANFSRVSPAIQTDARNPETGAKLGAKLVDVLLCNDALPIAGRTDTAQNVMDYALP